MNKLKLIAAILPLLALPACGADLPDAAPVAATREAANGDLAMPAEILPLDTRHSWGGGDFDPFLVKRPEINRPEEQERIRGLEVVWVIEKRRQRADESWEVRLGGKWYGEGDRIPGTEFRFGKIGEHSFEFISDTGMRFEIELRKPKRYSSDD